MQVMTGSIQEKPAFARHSDRSRVLCSYVIPSLTTSGSDGPQPTRWHAKLVAISTRTHIGITLAARCGRLGLIMMSRILYILECFQPHESQHADGSFDRRPMRLSLSRQMASVLNATSQDVNGEQTKRFSKERNSLSARRAWGRRGRWDLTISAICVMLKFPSLQCLAEGLLQRFNAEIHSPLLPGNRYSGPLKPKFRARQYLVPWRQRPCHWEQHMRRIGVAGRCWLWH